MPEHGTGGLKGEYVSYMCQHAVYGSGRWCCLKLGAAIVGTCFDVLFASFDGDCSLAAVQLCKWRIYILFWLMRALRVFADDLNSI